MNTPTASHRPERLVPPAHLASPHSGAAHPLAPLPSVAILAWPAPETPSPGASGLPAAAFSDDESEALRRCEAAVARHWESFLRAGHALAEIRDRRLYRSDYPTFEAYCRAKWSYGRVYAHRLIVAAETVNCLLPMGNTLPNHERQVRPLLASHLTDQEKRTAWRRAVDMAKGEAPTARQVQAAIAQMRGEPPPSQRHPRAKRRGSQREAAKKAMLKTLDSLDMCVRAKPDLALGLIRELKEMIHGL